MLFLYFFFLFLGHSPKCFKCAIIIALQGLPLGQRTCREAKVGQGVDRGEDGEESSPHPPTMNPSDATGLADRPPGHGGNGRPAGRGRSGQAAWAGGARRGAFCRASLRDRTAGNQVTRKGGTETGGVGVGPWGLAGLCDMPGTDCPCRQSLLTCS